MIGYKLEKAAEGDVEKVFANICSVRSAGIGDWDEGYPRLEDIQRDYDSGELYVARSGGDVIASAAICSGETDEDAQEVNDLKEVVWTPGRAAFLSRLCVAPQMQRHGIGAEMVHLTLRKTWELGYTVARFLAAETNPTALRLYERLNCRCVGRAYLFDEWFRCYELLPGDLGTASE